MSTSEKHLQSALKLGLSAKASAVYIFLLKSKKAVAPINIIKATELHRQYVYDALHELKEKELIEPKGTGRGVKYFAHTPNKILKEFEEKRLEAIEGANDLMNLFRKNPEGTIEIIEGAEAVVESEIKITREQENDSWMDIVGGAGTGFLELFGKRFGEYEKIRKEKKCKVRYIGSKKDISYVKRDDIKSREYYEARYIEGIDDVVNIVVRPDSVSFNIYAPEVVVIRLKNKETISGQRALFNILWNAAQKA